MPKFSGTRTSNYYSKNPLSGNSLVKHFAYTYFIFCLVFCWSLVVGQWSTTRHCPQQCSCTLQRTYVSMTGDYDELEILCNRYAARFGANLSAIPNMTQLKSNDYWIQVTMEQLEFETLSGEIFGHHKVKSLKIMNNLKLKAIKGESLVSVREYLEELVVLGNQALETFPYETLAVLSNLKLLSLQFVKNHTRWKSPVFPHVTSLETLNLMGAGFARYLKGLGHLKNLKQLSLGEMNAGSRKYVDRRFQFLLKLKNLTSLALEEVNLTVLPIHLSKMTQLKHLFLKSNMLTVNKQWPETGDLPANVEILDLRWNNYESFPCKVFGLANLNNLKTDADILCFSCAADKKRIEQKKAECASSGPTELKRRKSPEGPNVENSIADETTINDNDNDDSSGWFDEISEEEVEENRVQPEIPTELEVPVTEITQPVITVEKFHTPATQPTTVTIATTTTGQLATATTRSAVIKRPRTRAPTVGTFPTRIAPRVRATTRPLTSAAKFLPLSTPTYSFRVVTSKSSLKTPLTSISSQPIRSSPINTLRTDYFYEDDPDWKGEHLINPKFNGS